MASRVIGRLPVVYYPQTGKLEVENAGEFVEKQIYQRLDELAHGQPMHITLTVEPVNKARSTAQNSLMWALLTIMADHYNGGRTGRCDPGRTAIWRCWRSTVPRWIIWKSRRGALDILRGCYRLVHLVEILDNNRCTVKCTQGSSTFTTQEMKNMIEGIFDRLAEMGVSEPLVTAYWQEWSEP